MHVKRQRITAKSLPFLAVPDCLYICDFRSIGESFQHLIPAMWKYENLLPWIVFSGLVAVNDDFRQRPYLPHDNVRLTIAKKAEDARVAVAKRLDIEADTPVPNSIWTAVPHPDTDRLAEKFSCQLQYRYSDFLLLNNKIFQKRDFGKYTPSWETALSIESLSKHVGDNGVFLKRALGSGGYLVFSMAEISPEELLELWDNTDGKDWYIEKRVDGQAMSVQILSDSEGVTIFGMAKQKILNGKNFQGAWLLDIDDPVNQALLQDIAAILGELNIWKGYSGFSGLDFILGTDGKIHLLEANVRLTALTVPTLLLNESSSRTAFFEEDAQKTTSLEVDNRLTLLDDSYYGLSDTLNFV